MDRELIDKFIEITGEGEDTAAQYLSLTDGNLESAISLLFEAGGGGGGGIADSTEPRPIVNLDDEPEVRPPILPTQEVLVPPDVTCSYPRSSNSIFDRFRDFAVETRRQEEEMTQRALGARRTTNRNNRQRRLEDLFRPPCDILFLGSFMEAREHAKSMNRWLLVNVQDQQEFSCQVLNRDVWPNAQIREIINDHFVLWQVLSNSIDGKRYIDFYNVASYPYMAIIDPRTGECMRTIINNITVDTLVSDLNDMLSTHASPDNVETTPIKKKTSVSFSENLQNEAASNSYMTNVKRSRVIDASATSTKTTSESDLRESKPSTSVMSAPKTANFISKRSKIDEMEKSIEIEPEPPIDPAAPTVKLCLRLPNGSKETITIVANDTIENFMRRMERMGYPASEYTFLIPFPKTNIGELSMDVRLVDTILYPTNTVFITKI
ncbi:hypothetical protein TKK_0015846 [Trichogramma kaykai]|uniref:UBX domain-containing protein n=1 Tax=Trichogramma kaykai TaxID=54128 RepID=A0ABD2W853_9HYME